MRVRELCREVLYLDPLLNVEIAGIGKILPLVEACSDMRGFDENIMPHREQVIRGKVDAFLRLDEVFLELVKVLVLDAHSSFSKSDSVTYKGVCEPTNALVMLKSQYS